MFTDYILNTGTSTVCPNHTHSSFKNILQFQFVFQHVLFCSLFLKSHVISMYIKLYKENKASQAFWYKYNQHLGYKLVLPVIIYLNGGCSLIT